MTDAQKHAQSGMFVLETKNKPRGRLVREQDPDNKLVRVYKSSPEDLILQLWSGKRYMAVALEPAEARAIGEQLIEIADKLVEESHLTPLPEGELISIIKGASNGEGN